MDISNNINNIAGTYSALESSVKSAADKYQNNGTTIYRNDNSNISIDDVNEHSPRDLKRLKEVSQDFEALLMNQMFKSMRQSVNKTELIDGGMAEDIFEDMLYDEYSKSFAKSRKLGISEMIFNQMKDYV